MRGHLMGIYRLYTNDDGQSHIEEQHPSFHPDLTSPRRRERVFLKLDHSPFDKPKLQMA